MKFSKRFLLGAVLMAGTTLAVQAADSKAPAPKVDGISKSTAAAKEGGEKGDKGGGKVKMSGAAMGKDGGEKGDKGGGKVKMTGGAMAKDGGEKGDKGGGKDKMGMGMTGTARSKGADHDNKGGGKVKMHGAAMGKDGGEKGPGKDKMSGGMNQNMDQMKQSQGGMQR